MKRLMLLLAGLAIGGAAMAGEYKPWSETKILTINFSFPESVGVKATLTDLTKDPRLIDGGDLVAFAVTNGSAQIYPAGYVGLAVQAQYQGEGNTVELKGEGGKKIVGRVADGGQWVADSANAGRWLTKYNVEANQASADLRIVTAGQQTVEPGEYKIAVSAVHRTE